MSDGLLEKKQWTLEESHRYCKQLAKSHYENFPVGSLLIPKKLRPSIFAVYAFARHADDFADEPMDESRRIPLLDKWQRLLNDCYAKPVNHPVFLALAETVKKFDIPKYLFSDLLSAFKMDVIKKRQSTFEELLYYCRHSANPVGRILLYIFDKANEETLQLSDYVCTALQLTNFWQDVSVDLEKGRIYLPMEDFKKFDYSEAELKNRVLNLQFQRLLAFQVQRTKKLFRKSIDLPSLLEGRLALEMKLVISGGMKILSAIEIIKYDTLHQRPVLKGRDKLSVLWNSFFNFKSSLQKNKAAH